jgi:ADP-ribose pyrophosphatase
MKSTIMRRVRERRTQVLSSWVTLLEITMDENGIDEIYHGLEISDYIVVCGRTTSGLIPVVRQFRPVLGTVTMEFPAGLVDAGEAPEYAAGREFLEETGLTAKRLAPLGCHWTDTGRLTNRTYAYFTQADDPVSNESPEPGLELDFLTASQLDNAIKDGSFSHFLHVAAFLLAKARGHL